MGHSPFSTLAALVMCGACAAISHQTTLAACKITRRAGRLKHLVPPGGRYRRSLSSTARISRTTPASRCCSAADIRV